MTRRLIAFILLFGPAAAALAETLPCPSLSSAVQIGACPNEAELKYTFNGYCSDNARLYGKASDTCTDYQQYRSLKNTALWETAGGTFHAYISCDLPAASVKSAEATRISLAKQGKISQLVCDYRDGIVFTYRTRSECRLEGDGHCDSQGAACKASCE